MTLLAESLGSAHKPTLWFEGNLRSSSRTIRTFSRGPMRTCQASVLAPWYINSTYARPSSWFGRKKRVFALERDKAIAEEVRKLLEANFIREVYCLKRLANVVIVKKANGKWRMCVDFTNLNKACPKDSYPLPRIDLLVDSMVGHQLLRFMDANSGYNQIKLDEGDQEKTSFVTSQGLFCYKVMPFGIKNAVAAYQRLVNKMFAQQMCEMWKYM